METSQPPPWLDVSLSFNTSHKDKMTIESKSTVGGLGFTAIAATHTLHHEKVPPIAGRKANTSYAPNANAETSTPVRPEAPSYAPNASAPVRPERPNSITPTPYAPNA
ncbi:hypothetical protein PV11_03579 [Exophiala sideris]|uniref:Uncharacterized protein n=1 Tax=Exophiala sideris TaxID=1016849 RepID=A0A0D1Z3D9_9EURO|nr:hypothetical protein PV11_03579 [Exophiala sideris]